jgi:hypothetical protein
MAFVYMRTEAWEELKAITYLADANWNVLSSLTTFKQAWRAHVDLSNEGPNGIWTLRNYPPDNLPKEGHWDSWSLEGLKAAKMEYRAERRKFRIR